MVGWEAQSERTGVMDQAAGYTDQLVPQGGEHGLAVAGRRARVAARRTWAGR